MAGKPKFFLGMESTNMDYFRSRCCHAPLSLEPLCRVACGVCGKTERRPVHVSKLNKQ